MPKFEKIERVTIYSFSDKQDQAKIAKLYDAPAENVGIALTISTPIKSWSAHTFEQHVDLLKAIQNLDEVSVCGDFRILTEIVKRLRVRSVIIRYQGSEDQRLIEPLKDAFATNDSLESLTFCSNTYDCEPIYSLIAALKGIPDSRKEGIDLTLSSPYLDFMSPSKAQELARLNINTFTSVVGYALKPKNLKDNTYFLSHFVKSDSRIRKWIIAFNRSYYDYNSQQDRAYIEDFLQWFAKDGIKSLDISGLEFVSLHNKWDFKPRLNANGQPMLDRSGRQIKEYYEYIERVKLEVTYPPQALRYLMHLSHTKIAAFLLANQRASKGDRFSETNLNPDGLAQTLRLLGEDAKALVELFPVDRFLKTRYTYHSTYSTEVDKQQWKRVYEIEQKKQKQNELKQKEEKEAELKRINEQEKAAQLEKERIAQYKEYQKKLKQREEDIKAYFSLKDKGKEALKNGEFKKALKLFSQYETEAKKYEDVFLNVTINEFMQDSNAPRAKKQLMLLKMAQNQTWIADCYFAEGDHETALRVYLLALNNLFLCEAAHVLVGYSIAHQIGVSVKGALTDIEISKFGSVSVIYQVMEKIAYILSFLNRHDEAIQIYKFLLEEYYYRMILKSDPERHDFFYTNYALTILLQKGKEGIDEADKLIDLVNNDHTYNVNNVKGLLASEAEANYLFNKAKMEVDNLAFLGDRKAKLIEIMLDRARVFYVFGQVEKSYHCFKEILNLAPDHSYARKAIENLLPQYLELLFEKALNYLTQGHLLTALRLLEELLTLDPNHEAALKQYEQNYPKFISVMETEIGELHEKQGVLRKQAADSKDMAKKRYLKAQELQRKESFHVEVKAANDFAREKNTCLREASEFEKKAADLEGEAQECLNKANRYCVEVEGFKQAQAQMGVNNAFQQTSTLSLIEQKSIHKKDRQKPVSSALTLVEAENIPSNIRLQHIFNQFKKYQIDASSLEMFGDLFAKGDYLFRLALVNGAEPTSPEMAVLAIQNLFETLTRENISQRDRFLAELRLIFRKNKLTKQFSMQDITKAFLGDGLVDSLESARQQSVASTSENIRNITLAWLMEAPVEEDDPYAHFAEYTDFLVATRDHYIKKRTKEERIRDVVLSSQLIDNMYGKISPEALNENLSFVLITEASRGRTNTVKILLEKGVRDNFVLQTTGVHALAAVCMKLSQGRYFEEDKYFACAMLLIKAYRKKPFSINGTPYLDIKFKDDSGVLRSCWEYVINVTDEINDNLMRDKLVKAQHLELSATKALIQAEKKNAEAKHYDKIAKEWIDRLHLNLLSVELVKKTLYDYRKKYNTLAFTPEKNHEEMYDLHHKIIAIREQIYNLQRTADLFNKEAARASTTSQFLNMEAGKLIQEANSLTFEANLLKQQANTSYRKLKTDEEKQHLPKREVLLKEFMLAGADPNFDQLSLTSFLRLPEAQALELIKILMGDFAEAKDNPLVNRCSRQTVIDSLKKLENPLPRIIFDYLSNRFNFSKEDLIDAARNLKKIDQEVPEVKIPVIAPPVPVVIPPELKNLVNNGLEAIRRRVNFLEKSLIEKGALQEYIDFAKKIKDNIDQANNLISGSDEQVNFLKELIDKIPAYFNSKILNNRSVDIKILKLFLVVSFALQNLRDDIEQFKSGKVIDIRNPLLPLIDAPQPPLPAAPQQPLPAAPQQPNQQSQPENKAANEAELKEVLSPEQIALRNELNRCLRSCDAFLVRGWNKSNTFDAALSLLIDTGESFDSVILDREKFAENTLAALQNRNHEVAEQADFIGQHGLYLIFRIRVLLEKFHTLMSEKRNSPLDNSDLTLMNEILWCLECFRFYQQITLIDVRNFVKSYSELADKLIKRLNILTEGQQFTLLTGWQEHAVTLNFVRLKDAIAIRVDNSVYIQLPGETAFHEYTRGNFFGSGSLKPAILGEISLSDLKKNKPYFCSLIRNVHIQNQVTFTNGAKNLYANPELQKRSTNYKFVKAFPEQAKSNCWVQCYLPGEHARLGSDVVELYKKYMIQSAQEMRNRSAAAVAPAVARRR